MLFTIHVIDNQAAQVWLDGVYKASFTGRTFKADAIRFVRSCGGRFKFTGDK